MNLRRSCVSLVVAAGVFGGMVPLHSAYTGHGADQDIKAVLAAYPDAKGTPTDSCAICHRSGEVKDALGAGASRHENHCDYCHAVFVRAKRDVRETLNAYGAAYLGAGRSEGAVRGLATKDSDGDGFSNDEELRKGTNPGEASSNPSLPMAPSRRYTATALRGLSPVIEQTVFVNSTKSRSGDSYGDYRGNAAWAILEAIGLAGTATSVDFLSADGYERTFTVAELKRRWSQAPPVMGLGTTELGPCGWVSYRARSLDPSTALPPAVILLAFEQDGQPLRKASIDASGRLNGQGPIRVIVPQFEVSPPDLPQTADTSCAAKVAAAHRFHEDYDHNAGKSSSAVVAVRINPLPKGTRDLDWQTMAPRDLANEEIVFFGALVPAKTNRGPD
jgi:hypothetical protein